MTCLKGARQGTRLVFDEGVVTFGRRPDSHVNFADSDESVSGRHAEARVVDGNWVLRDVGSLNGIYVDERRVQVQVLGPSTVVELGNGGPLVRLEVTDAEGASIRPAERTVMRPARRSTTFYKLIIEDTVKRSSARLKYVIIGLSAAFVVAIAILWVVLAQKSDRGESLAAETIASRYAKSVFMLIAQRDGKEVGFCTAFAVSRDGVLVTNAHCVRELKDMRARSRIVARMNTAPDNTFEVLRWKEHPAYDGSDLSPDVALLEVAVGPEGLPVVAELAAPEVAVAMAAGQPIYTLGFPGQVMNEARPAADLRAAVVSRLTTKDNTSGDAASAYVVWHSALTSKGTSGSPVFDAAGRVVAVNSGGLSARELTVTDPVTGATRTEVIAEANGLNYAIRVDRVSDLVMR